MSEVGGAPGPAERARWLADQLADAADLAPPTGGPAVVAGESGLHLLAGALRVLHDLPVAACPFDSSNAALLAEARRRVAAGVVDPDAFDPAYRRHTPEQLLAWAEAADLPPTPEGGPVVIHGDARLAHLELDPADGRATWSALGRLGAGDPYRDLATLSVDLVAGGATSEVLGTFFEACGIEHPDVRRLDHHLLLDQLLR